MPRFYLNLSIPWLSQSLHVLMQREVPVTTGLMRGLILPVHRHARRMAGVSSAALVSKLTLPVLGHELGPRGDNELQPKPFSDLKLPGDS